MKSLQRETAEDIVSNQFDCAGLYLSHIYITNRNVQIRYAHNLLLAIGKQIA